MKIKMNFIVPLGKTLISQPTLSLMGHSDGGRAQAVHPRTGAQPLHMISNEALLSSSFGCSGSVEDIYGF